MEDSDACRTIESYDHPKKLDEIAEVSFLSGVELEVAWGEQVP